MRLAFRRSSSAARSLAAAASAAACALMAAAVRRLPVAGASVVRAAFESWNDTTPLVCEWNKLVPKYNAVVASKKVGLPGRQVRRNASKSSGFVRLARSLRGTVAHAGLAGHIPKQRTDRELNQETIIGSQKGTFPAVSG